MLGYMLVVSLKGANQGGHAPVTFEKHTPIWALVVPPLALHAIKQPRMCTHTSRRILLELIPVPHNVQYALEHASQCVMSCKSYLL